MMNWRLTAKTCVVFAALSSSIANAQIGTGTFTWQLSLDDGVTWQTGVVEAPQTQQRVHVRAVAAWDNFDTGWAYASTAFDATWTSAGPGGLGDSAGEMMHIEPFTVSFQTLRASRFGQVVKIDDSRDTQPPGMGANWVANGQYDSGFGQPFSSANPVAVFRYSMTLDGSLGERTASAVFLNRGAPGRFMTLFLRPGTGSNRPLTTQVSATLRVIPSPGTLALLGALVFAPRRRLPHSNGFTNNPVANFG